MAQIPILLEYEEARLKLIDNIPDDYSDVRDWWYAYNRKKPTEQDEKTGSTKRRLQAFLTNKFIRHIVGQSKSTLHFRQITDERKILLVKLSLEYGEVTTLVGSMIIGLLLTAAYGRDTREDTEEQRPHFCIYADEFQHFATLDFAKLFTETGKFHYAPTVAHQERVGQFEQHDKNRGATLAAANMVVYRTTIHDASEIAPEFAKKPPPAETKREEKLTPVSKPLDFLLSGKTHPNRTVNDFVKHWKLHDIQENELRPITRQDTQLSNMLHEQGDLIRYLNILFYEVTKEKNPHMALLLLYFQYIVRAVGFPFFEAEQFEEWALDSQTHYGFTQHGRSYAMDVAFYERKSKRHEFSITWRDGHFPYDYCSFLFREGTTGELPLSDEEQAIYNRLWTTADERSLADAFAVYEQLVRRTLYTQIKTLIHTYFSSLYTRFKIPKRDDDIYEPYICSELRAWKKKSYEERHGEKYPDIYGSFDLYWSEKNLGLEWLPIAFETLTWERDSYGNWQIAAGELERLDIDPYIREEIEKIIAEHKPSFEAFVREFRDVLQALVDQPIAAGSGIYEMVPGTQRTFADMVNEMALELPNLPRYTAYCKIVKEVAGVQRILKYQLYPDPLSYVSDQQVLFAVSQRKEIEDRTHKLYCRERITVEDEIKEKRDYLLKPIKKERKTRQDEE